MTRTDISNFLGLRIETVSRLFTRLQKNNVITIDKTDLIIDDMNALQLIAKGTDGA